MRNVPKKLREYLRRTAVSISDLERSKVQVTASDLYKISKFLRIPIKCFYGEDFRGEEIQSLVSILREQAPEYRKANIEYIQKTVRLQILGKEISNKSDEEISADQMKEFMELLIDITNMNKTASGQVESATKRLLTEIDFKGIDFSEFISKLNS